MNWLINLKNIFITFKNRIFASRKSDWYLECYLNYWKGFGVVDIRKTASTVYRSKSLIKLVTCWYEINRFYDKCKIVRNTKNDYIYDLDDSYSLKKINPSQYELDKIPTSDIIKLETVQDFS